MANRLYDLMRLNFALYPGVVNYRAAEFLAPLYEARKRQQSKLRIALNAVIFLVWWLWIPFRARQVAGKWRKDPDWVKSATQLGRQGFCDPNDLALFRIVENGGLDQHQRRFEQASVIRTIESDETDHAPFMLDKMCFHERCSAAGLAVPHLIAVVDNGVVHWHDSPDPIMLAKPASGSGGAGITLIDNETLRDGEIPSAFSSGRWLIQRRLLPHPTLAGITFETLATARIITLLDESGAPEIVFAGLRFAGHPGAIVDNAHQGGFGAPIELHSGELGGGMVVNGPDEFDRHPHSNAPIRGQILPDWEAAKALALGAHEKLAMDQVIVGWDVGFSDNGPILIEANQRPSVRLTQRLAGQGIGAMRYGDLINYHLRRSLDATSRSRKRVLRSG